MKKLAAVFGLVAALALFSLIGATGALDTGSMAFETWKVFAPVSALVFGASAGLGSILWTKGDIYEQ